MDSPGGSTPRGTPVRMTPVTHTRGNHQPRASSLSSCLLEEVLAEKKMGLLRSPEVIQWLHDYQQEVKIQTAPQSQDPDTGQDTRRPSGSNPTARNQSGDRGPQNLHQFPIQGEMSVEASSAQRQVQHDTENDVLKILSESQLYLPHQETSMEVGNNGEIRPSEGMSMIQDNHTQLQHLIGPQVTDPQYLLPDQTVRPNQTALYLPDMTHTEPDQSSQDPCRSRLVTQWLNDNVHPLHTSGQLSTARQNPSQPYDEQQVLQGHIDVTDNVYKIS